MSVIGPWEVITSTFFFQCQIKGIKGRSKARAMFISGYMYNKLYEINVC
jgi:hypothetical protein